MFVCSCESTHVLKRIQVKVYPGSKTEGNCEPFGVGAGNQNQTNC